MDGWRTALWGFYVLSKDTMTFSRLDPEPLVPIAGHWPLGQWLSHIKIHFWNKECCSLLLSSAFWVSCSSEELFPFALSPTVNNWRWLVKVLSNAVLLVLVLIDEKSVHHRLPSHSHPPTPQVFFQVALYLLKYYLHCTCQEIICFKC